ncbi:MAG: hypothetical protein K0Q91_1686 [Fibrobacteria bacterium]|nr:hypothetical protein [Fibrobacteria bacterium]
MLQVIAAAADEGLGSRILANRRDLGAGFRVVREQRAAGGKRGGFGGSRFLGGGKVAGFAEFAARTVLAAGTTVALGATFTSAFGALRAVFAATAAFAAFTRTTIPFATLGAGATVGTVALTAGTVLAAAFATFTTFAALRARATVAFGTRAAAFTARGTVFAAAFATAVTAFAALRTGTAVAALGTAAFAAATVQDFIQFDGFQAELGGHFLDDGLLKQVKNGFEAEENEEAHDQRCRRKGQEEIRGYHEECFLGSMYSGGAASLAAPFAGLTRPDWIASLPVDAEKFRARGEYSIFWKRGRGLDHWDPGSAPYLEVRAAGPPGKPSRSVVKGEGGGLRRKIVKHRIQ